MAVALDYKTGPGATSGLTGTGSSFSATLGGTGIGSGANRVAVGFIIFGSNSSALPASLAMTYDSSSMTQIASASQTDGHGGGANKTCTAAFAILNPTSGAKVLAGSWTGSREFAVYFVSFTGADQGSVTVTCPGASNSDSSAGGSDPATITITSTANDAMCCSVVDNNSVGSAILSDTQLDNFFTGSTMDGTAQEAVGTGTHSMTFTGTVAFTNWAIAGTRVIAVGGVGGGPVGYMIM